jgi:hypothetical protein
VQVAARISVTAGRIGMATTVYTAIIEKEGDLYAALCPELDVASQGETVEEATLNLREAVVLPRRPVGTRRRSDPSVARAR